MLFFRPASSLSTLSVLPFISLRLAPFSARGIVGLVERELGTLAAYWLMAAMDSLYMREWRGGWRRRWEVRVSWGRVVRVRRGGGRGWGRGMAIEKNLENWCLRDK